MKRTKFKGTYIHYQEKGEAIKNRVLIIKGEYYCSIEHKKFLCGYYVIDNKVYDDLEMAISRLKRGLKTGEIVKIA